MSHPISAAFRITFNYTVDGLAHRFRHYVGAAPGSGATGYNITFRDATAGVDFSTVVDAFWNVWKATLQVTLSSIGSALLEEYSGGAYIPRASYSTSVAPTATSAYYKAGQGTVTMRDDEYRVLRLIWLEGIIAPGQKVTALSSGTYGTPLLKYITQPAAGVPDPWNWVLSRSGRPVKSFTALTSDLNDSTRRARGIA